VTSPPSGPPSRALAAEFRERAQVAAALARLQPSPTAEETAGDICGELFALPGIDFAAIVDFAEPGRAITLAVGGPDGLPVDRGQLLPATRASHLYERALQGPWAEAWRARPGDGLYGATMTRLGLKAARAPIPNGRASSASSPPGRAARRTRAMIDHLRLSAVRLDGARSLARIWVGPRSDLMKGRISRVQPTAASALSSSRSSRWPRPSP
jgi:hypothetical protein